MYLIYDNYSNKVVIKYYLDIIKRALECKGEQVEYINTLKGVKRKETIIIPYSVDAAIAYLKGYKNIIVWEQGLPAEESFMRNKSIFRKYVYDKCIKYGLRKAKFCFFVSEAMKQYLSDKYKLSFDSNSYIMPCFNTDFHIECFNNKTRYERKVFTYVGSLAIWQCFQETLDLYKKIENEIQNCELRVYTFSVDEAIQQIQEKGIKNFSVECVSNDELPQKLKTVTYGFVIRDNNIVNQVATPTKLSTYLSCGVIPIFSSSLTSFFELSKTLKYTIPLFGDKQDINRIIDFCKYRIDSNELTTEYSDVFKNYYGKEKYINEIGEILISIE